MLRRFFIVIILCLLPFCVFSQPANQIIYDNEYGNHYAACVHEALLADEEYTYQGEHDSLLEAFSNQEGAVEADSVQANALTKNKDVYWYPHYQATVVLAVNRDLCQDRITGWNDVLTNHNTVSIATLAPEFYYYVMAVAYGESGIWKIDSAVSYFKVLHDQGLLQQYNLFSLFNYLDQGQSGDYAQIRILYDYQAVQLNMQGKHYEIVVPVEGTLTVQKGILSRKPLLFDEEKMHETLLRQGFRPIDTSRLITDENAKAELPEQPVVKDLRKRVSTYYPAELMYQKANRIAEPEQFLMEADNATRKIRREVLDQRHIFSADGYEHTLQYMVLIVVTVFVMGRLLFSVLQTGVRRALWGLSASLVLFITVRLVRLGLYNYYDDLLRWVWYSYYFFYFVLSLFLLWLAWAVNRPVEEKNPPRWWFVVLGCSCVAVLLVLTNDVHQWVWQFLPDFQDSNYIHHDTWVIYAITIFYMMMMLAASSILIQKACHNSYLRYKVILPVGVLLLLFFYIYAYGVNLWNLGRTEKVFHLCLGYLLFIITASYTGLLSTNKQYRELFTLSTLGMQIRDQDDQLIFQSGRKLPEAMTDLIAHRNTITGGQVLWYENVRELNNLKRELRLTTEALQRSHMLLAQEEQLKGSFIALRIRNKLYDELEEIIAKKQLDIVDDLTTLQDESVSKEQKDSAIKHVNILACYLKKKCVMVLHAKGDNSLETTSLTAAFEESCRYTKQAGIDCVLRTKIEKQVIGSLAAMILYDAFEMIVERTLSGKAETLLVQLGENGERLEMSCLIGGGRKEDLLDNLPKLAAQFGFVGTTSSVKDLEDAISFVMNVGIR